MHFSYKGGSVHFVIITNVNFILILQIKNSFEYTNDKTSFDFDKHTFECSVVSSYSVHSITSLYLFIDAKGINWR